MARRTDELILAEVREIKTEIREIKAEVRTTNTRIDALHGRIDTVIDSIADLRSDFATHTHND